MGAFDSNPRSDLSGVSRGYQHWIPPAEGISVGGVGNLADRFSGLILGDGRNEGVHQIIKAVEDAENTIKQQLEENYLLKKEKLEENNLLKKEILQKTRELENYRLEAMPLRPSDISTNGHVEVYKIHHSNSSAAIESDRNRWLENHPTLNPQSMLVLHENGVAGREKPSVETATSNQPYYEINKVNGDLKKFPGLPSALDNAGPSQYSTPSSRSVSPSRHQKDGEHDRRFSLSGNGLVPVSDLHSNIPWKQELIIKVREHEDEIAQLKKHLADYSLKEAQIRNEKYVLEKRIAYMRMAFDQQQQELVDAASKAISYRQDIIEENIRLTYALQAAQAERSTFVSSLVPLLSEHGLQPSAVDAQSIVGNLKVLFRHMQEKLFIAEERMKESQYLMAPWYAESSNNAGFPSQSPYHPTGTQVALPNKNSLEIVPQPYSNAQLVPNSHTRHEWKAVGNQNQQPNTGSVPTKNLDQDALETNTLSIRRDHSAHDTSETNQSETRSARLNVDSKSQHLSFKHLVKSVRGDESETVPQHGKEPSVQWAPGTSAYLPSGQDEPNAYTYLPTVLEERSSSFSEADDEPLPAIDGLQISGEAYPGRELQASGYQINGTTSCNFEWVRYLEDGSVHYIDGAKQPNYLVTADDVDSYLAIEVQPLDDRKRKGELVKVFANEQRKITCDPDMQELIKSTLSVGHASYEVSLLTRFLDIWEPAVLAIKREGYSIKCSGPRVVVTEKFQQNTTILIPYGHPTEFLIQYASGEFLLKTEESTLRDTIVLTMRCFKMKASEKRKGRKKGLFFK